MGLILIHLAEARAAGIKVAISGLGGDEIFAGYSSFGTVRAWNALQARGGASGDCANPDNVYAALAVLPTRSQADGTRPQRRTGHHPYSFRDVIHPNQRTVAGRSSVNWSQCDVSIPTRGKTINRLPQPRAEPGPINRVPIWRRGVICSHIVTGFGLHEHGARLELRVPLIAIDWQTVWVPGAWKLDEPPKPCWFETAARTSRSIVHRKNEGSLCHSNIGAGCVAPVFRNHVRD